MRFPRALLAVGLFAGTTAAVGQAAPVNASQTLTTITPQTILDTLDSGAKVGNVFGAAYQLNIDEVPGDAVAVGLNLTLSSTETLSGTGYLTVYPCGVRPDTAVAVFSSGISLRTSLLAELDVNGDTCFYVNGKTHLAIELFGYMASGSSYSTTNTSRLLDSRMSDEVTTERRISVGSVPAGAMVDLRVSAASPSASGIVTVSDCGSNTFSFEVYKGVTASHPVMVTSSGSQEICVRSTGATHLTVDLRGYDTMATRSIYPSGASAIDHSYSGSAFTTSWTSANPDSNVDHYVALVAGSTGSFECSTAASPAAMSCTAAASSAQLGNDRWFSSSVWAVSDVGAYGPSASSGIAAVFLVPTNPSAPSRADALLLQDGIFLTDGDLRPGVETDVVFAPGSFQPSDWVVVSLLPDLSDATDTTEPIVIGTGEVANDGSLSMTLTAPASLTAGTTKTLVALGTTYTTGFRENVSVASPASASSSDGWDYVYGNPGPYDYSEFLEVYPTSDGGAFLVGQWAGDFEGMSAGAAYRLFVQRRSADGTVEWTSAPPVGSSSTSQSVYGAVDGDDVLYLLVGSASPVIPTGTVLTYGADGLMRLSEVGDLMSGSLSVEDGPNRMIVSPVSGALLIEAGSSGPPSARRINSSLEETGSVSVSAEFLSSSASAPAAFPKVVGAFAPDGAFWLTGTIARPLPHMEDAIGFMKIPVADDGSLSASTTIKHYGYECGSWWEVPRITDESIWLYGCGESYPWQSMYAFSPVDGALLGEVSGLAPTRGVMGSDMPSEAPYYLFCATSDGSCVPVGIDEYVAATAAQYSPDGSLAFVEIEAGDLTWSIPGSGGRVLTTWSITDSGSASTWTLLSDEQVTTGVEVEAVAPIDEDSVILVGSTTVDLNVRGRELGTSSTTKRAFIDARTISTESSETNSGSGTSSSAATFVSLTPDRILDTRSSDPVGELDGSGDALTLQVTGVGGVPASAMAVALNVTVVDGEANDFGGFVTVFPCGTRPDSSNLNFVSGQTVPNSVIAPLSSSGTVCLYVYGVADLLVDVSGHM